ncbi:MAG TPA: type II CAAX endopeptidase family protein [Polyangiaceae bacterium]|nr:type II CAAX endopeptidase family protein [Polyangiaceae bacterium]
MKTLHVTSWAQDQSRRDSEAPQRTPMNDKTLLRLLAMSFGLTWSIAAILILFYDQVTAIFGELTVSNPLYILAVYSPGIAGVFLVWRHYGITGLGRFFRRLTLWRAPLGWWAFLVLGVPAVVYTGAAIKGSISDPLPVSGGYQIVSALLLALFLGPIEEFGWRGVALPILQRRFAPIWAGLILGTLIAIWHIPAFFLSGAPMSSWSFAPYFGAVIAIYVILTPFFNAARGSLLVAYLYHFQMMNPLFPDAQPWDNLLWIAVAIVVVWWKRDVLFDRAAAVTEVL